MNFNECCEMCLTNKEFVKQFDRLNETNLGEILDRFKKRTVLDKMIDNACEYDPFEKVMPIFIDFVAKYIWIPLLETVDK